MSSSTWSEMRRRPRIGVMGPSACSDRVLDLARQVGILLAKSNAVLVCGGRTGVMEASARGAKEAGGITVGILPGASAADANPWIDLPIVTDLGNARNVINILTSQAIIAIAGAFGTLSEIALALKCGTPVVALESWELRSPEGEIPAGIIRVGSPDEAVREAIRLAGAQGSAS